MPHFISLATISGQKQNYNNFFPEQIKDLILGSADPKEIEEAEKIFEIYKTSGTEDAARYTIDVWKKAQELEDISPARLVAPYVILKDKEKLMNTLERCYQERTQPIVVLKVAPDFDFIRSEPRFKALLKKVGLDN